MASFTIRVELQKYATSGQYEDLRVAMANVGFLHWISGEYDDGTPATAILPPGLYFGPSDLSCRQVRDLVSGIAMAIDNDYKVFVAETVHWNSLNC